MSEEDKGRAEESAATDRRKNEPHAHGFESLHYPQTGVAVTCRSYREYEAMFMLDEETLRRGRVLDVAAGASSFAAEAKAKGMDVTAADPRYAQPPESLLPDTAEEIAVSTAKLARLQDRFDWTFYGSLSLHRAIREQSMERFAADYRADFAEASRAGGQPGIRRAYVPALLPALPFADASFSLVLCSHFLFLYEEQFSPGFHRDAVLEMYRLLKPGGELRIYPLQTLRFTASSVLEDAWRALHTAGAAVERLPTGLPFIPGSTHLLRAVKSVP